MQTKTEKAIKNKWGLDRSAPEKEIKAGAVWRLFEATAIRHNTEKKATATALT